MRHLARRMRSRENTVKRTVTMTVTTTTMATSDHDALPSSSAYRYERAVFACRPAAGASSAATLLAAARLP